MAMYWQKSEINEDLDFDEKIPLKYGIDISTCQNLDEVIESYKKQAKEHNFEIVDVDFFDETSVNFWFPKIGMQTLTFETLDEIKDAILIKEGLISLEDFLKSKNDTRKLYFVDESEPLTLSEYYVCKWSDLENGEDVYTFDYISDELKIEGVLGDEFELKKTNN